MTDLAERVEEAWTELASRLSLTGKHCGWFKSWLTEIVKRERQVALRDAAHHVPEKDIRGMVLDRLTRATIREWLRARAAEEEKG